MRKTLSLALTFTLIITLLTSIGLTFQVEASSVDNLLIGTKGTFEQTTVPDGWSAFGGGTLSTSTTVSRNGSYALKLAGRTQSWYSPTYNVYDIFKTNGAGYYTLSIWVYVDSLASSPGLGRLIIRGTSEDDNSFIDNYGGNYYAPLTNNISTPVSTWVQYTANLEVLASDLTRESGTFNLMIDNLAGDTGQNLYFDDVQIYKAVEQWRSFELSFESDYEGTELITGVQSTFEQETVPTGWSAFGGGTISTSTTVARSGSRSLKMSGRTATYHSPTINIYDTLKAQGSGIYTISVWVYADAVYDNPAKGSLIIRGSSSSDENSFISNYSGNYYGILTSGVSTFLDSWTLYSATLTVLESDLTRDSGNGTFNLMLDGINPPSGQNIYLDDFSIYKETANNLTGGTSSFESASVPGGWSAFGGGTLSTSTTVSRNGTYALKLAGRTQSWYSPTYNVYDIFKTNGAGNYTISTWVYVDSLASSPGLGRLIIRGTSEDDNSFIDNYSGNYYAPLTNNISTPVNTWVLYTANLEVLASDLTRESGTFNLMIDNLAGNAGQNLYFDDVQIHKGYTSPLYDAVMDVTFTGPGSTTMVMPAFWDGKNIWKVRFAPPLTGMWSYTTSCSNTTDSGLHNQSGAFSCVAYTGDHSIYQKGFIKTESNTRYFMYDDGTPFFYLGDTHWTMPTESFDSSTVEGINSQFKHIVDDRVGKGFTVYQSEPIGASYNLRDGLSAADLGGFADLDQKFRYIADQGLVHSNAQLFFASDLVNYGSSFSTEYLQKLTRYWVARYASYPVMWSTAQEVDNDFYGEFDISTNPWKTVFNALHLYDPYEHPLTAHQENVGHTMASNSAFKSLSGHSWFGAQWAPAKNAVLDFNVAKNYWDNSSGKPVVNYEGHYENLWTNEFGARHQGWTAYLNGMFGHGYGAQDIWAYDSDYDEENPTTVYGITVTVEMKQVTWDTSVDFNTPTQLGYMKSFFQTIGWHNLTPRFDSTTWFSNNSSYYSVASISNTTYVVYFYNSTTNTGTLKNMNNSQYTGYWFNPRSGSYTYIGVFTPSSNQWNIPSKPDGNDWVLIVYQ